MMRIHRSAALALLLIVDPGLAQGQPKPPEKGRGEATGKAPAKKEAPRPLEERLKDLGTRIDEAARAAADSAAAMKALQELQNQVNGMRQEVERQGSMLRGYEEARRKAQEHEDRMGNMELQLSAMRMQLTGRGDIAGYDRGFFLQSPNRKFLLRLNGLLQAAFLGRIFSGKVYSGEVTSENESTFALRRAGLEAGGHLFLPELAFHLALDFGSVDPGPLLEAYGDLKVHRFLHLRGGKQLVPLGRQFLTHSSAQQFVERLGVVESFAPGWDLGALLHGDLPVLGRLTYQVGMFNGAGPGAAANDNIDFLYAVRLTCEPFGPLEEGEGDLERSPPKLAVGAAFTYNLARTDMALRKGIVDPTKVTAQNDVDGDGRVDNVSIYSLGLELAVRWRGASLQSEFFFRQEDPGAAAESRSFWGIYGQASWIPFYRNLELAARYGYWQPHYYGEDRREHLAQSIHEVAAVVNLYTWTRLLKWQAEYSHQWQRDLQSVTGLIAGERDIYLNVSQVTLQLQAAF